MPHIHFSKKKIIFLIFALIIGVVFFYQRQASKTAVKSESAYKIKRQDLKESLSFSGTIDASEKAILRFASSGKLAWVGVK
jgi:multidrug efflux pump subunit AcrA (membrane-fusion protein)